MNRTCIFLVLVCGCFFSSCSSPSSQDDNYFTGSQLAPPSESTLLMTGRVLASKGLANQAELVLGRLIKDHPNYLPGYTELAELLLNEGRIEDSILVLNAAMKIFPNNPILQNDIGMCRLLQGDLDAASVAFNQARDTSPRDSVYIGNCALVAALQGDDSKALELWNNILGKRDSLINLREAQSSSLYRGASSGS